MTQLEICPTLFNWYDPLEDHNHYKYYTPVSSCHTQVHEDLASITIIISWLVVSRHHINPNLTV